MQRADLSRCTIPAILEDSRKTTLPISRENLWKYYEMAYKSFWTPEEVDISKDRTDYKYVLGENERRMVDYILGFFATADSLVVDNLAERFCSEIDIFEAKYFYGFQIAIENIHAHMYSSLLDTILPTAEERDRVLRAASTMPVIGEMTDYITECTKSDASFAERLLRMACVEGVLFTGCFCAIYWLQQRRGSGGSPMPGLGHSNELIARDESLHAQFALELYSMIPSAHRPITTRVHQILAAAASLAKKFASDAIPEGMPGMNAVLMCKYIECVTDNIAIMAGENVLFGTPNPFPFMEQLNMLNRTNFFERRVSEYSKPTSADSDNSIEMDF